MNRMKFYKELPNGKIAVLEVRVNQSLSVPSGVSRRSPQKATPAAAMDIAAKEAFVCRRDFGDKRLATAKREGRLLPAKRTAVRA
jgi:hypothetical protein